MEKIVVSFKRNTTVEMDWQGQKLSVIPHINVGLQSLLIERYLERYFNPKQNSIPGCRYAFVDAEGELKVSIVSELTNIELKDADLIEMLACGLFEKLVGYVDNWGEFKAFLYKSVTIVEKELELKESVGGVIAGVASKINELLEKLNSISPDEMKELVSQSQGLLKGLENSPASSVFLEAGKNKASKAQ